ncbi:histone-like nucleoid-structuring protein Lsr2 [Streptomyces sp. NBC_00233]|uniref:Lsr2 family DNA-binding protein n=1 Tax=Streptomyces sp. NBC_00233 TaxID=2975686 RepID=UPI0022502047|nr:histone-like nucleoid-structuring protein Lsr2 [Streptomyces sp. NBC_00233]MCX5231529.1 Lsr2 family protein [Streptomyces sp. NBC_00233]
MTDLAGLAALTALCPPPGVVPPAPDWPRAEVLLGMRLPRDYKELVAVYGPGEFCDFLTLYRPGALSEWVDLTGPMPARLRAQLDAGRTADTHRRGTLPCATEDLLAMGVTGNGHYLFWDTRPRDAPDRWTVAVTERLGAPWFTYSGSVTTFLVDVLRGTLHVPLFPRDLLADGPAFTPSRLRSRVPVTAPSTRPPVDTSTIRTWARANGYDVPDRGRVPIAILEAWVAATHSE